MNKIGFFSVLLFLASTYVKADNFKYLTVGYGDTEESISLPTIQKITFGEGKCYVTCTDGVYTYPLSEMKKMTFTVEATAIEALPETAKGIAFDKGILSIDGTGMLRIYNASGALVQMTKVAGNVNISLSNLPSGLYIVNMGESTIKLRK